MFIQVIPNRGSPPAILLRESYREGGKIKKRTLCNLTHWPPSLLEGFKALLKGGTVMSAPADQEVFTIRRALPHGHVAAVLGTLRHIGSRSAPRTCRQPLPRPRHRHDRRAAHRAGLQARHRPPCSTRSPPPPASARSWAWARSTRTNSMSPSTGSASARPAVERALASASICATARWCSTTCRRATWRAAAASWRRRGYNRDGKKGKLQIVYGLLCAPDGCPVAIEVFEGDTADPRTLAAQIDKVKKRFALDARGAGRRPRNDHAGAHRRRDRPGGARLDHGVARAGHPGACRGRALQLSLFDERDMAAITSPDYPGERLIVCRNPDLARERGAQARGPAGRDRARPRQGRSRRGPRAQAAAQRGGDCARGRGGARTGTRWPSTSS